MAYSTTMLRSTRYSGIQVRGSKVKAEQVQAELQAVIDAQPTQIHPDDREGYLTAILADLQPVEGATWISWSEEVHLQALTAVRILGRNPMGSKCMLTTQSISTLLYHAALAHAPHSLPSTSNSSSKDNDSSAPAVPPIETRSATATETLKVLANLLVLHPIARKRLTRQGGCRGVILALKGKNVVKALDEAEGYARGTDAGKHDGKAAEADGIEEYGEDAGQGDLEGDDTPERVFLLARLLFLMTAGEDALSREIVQKDGVVDGLVYHLLNLAPIPAHYDALSELFKAANNLVVAFSDRPSWPEQLDPLIHCTILHLHLLPLSTLSPPLTHIVHVLFSAPLTPGTSAIFTRAPEILPASPTSAMAALGLSGVGAGAAGNGVRSLISRIGQLPGQIRGMAGAGANAGAGGGLEGANGQGKEEDRGKGLGMSGVGAGASAEVDQGVVNGASSPEGDRPKTLRERLSFSLPRPSLSPAQITGSLPPDPPNPPIIPEDPRPQSPLRPYHRPILPLPPLMAAPTALPARLLPLLSAFLSTYLPSLTPDNELHASSAIDEALPPLLLLLVKVAENNTEARRWLKGEMLPDGLDRSEAAGPLEERQGILGGLLRLMRSTRYERSRGAAGELIWVVCGSDASTMSADIGYGNAAGFLFHKGITQKPSGTITEITEIDDSAPSVSDTKSNASLEARHPITSLTPDPSSSSAAAAAAAGVANMTQEEKEREAERLFVLFQRMERNPVLSLGAETDPTPSGESGAVGANGSTPNGGTNGKGGKAVNIEDLMRQKLHSGEHAQMDVQEEQEERERREREEEEDEREVGREMADYRARMSKGRGG